MAPLLLEKGYTIKVFDLIDPAHSDAFNPFPYIRDDKDTMKPVHNLIKNTTPKGSHESDPFWEECDSFADGKKSADKQQVSVAWITGNSTGGMKR